MSSYIKEGDKVRVTETGFESEVSHVEGFRIYLIGYKDYFVKEELELLNH